MSELKVFARKEYAFLSNMYTLGHPIRGFPSLEHAYIAEKYGPDLDWSEYKAMSPGTAKRLVRLTTLTPRPDWYDVKKFIMLKLLREKFAYGTPMAARLLSTGTHELVIQCLHHDNYWEDCVCMEVSPEIAKYGSKVECTNPGKNVLGQLLTKVREEVREVLNVNIAAGDVTHPDGRLFGYDVGTDDHRTPYR